MIYDGIGQSNNKLISSILPENMAQRTGKRPMPFNVEEEF